MFRSRIIRLAVCGVVVAGVAGVVGPVSGAGATSTPPLEPATVAQRHADAAAAGLRAVAAATRFVAARSDSLHAGPDDEFVQQPAVSSLGWQYVPYERTYRGLPVIGGDFVVVVDPAGEVSSTSVAQKQPVKALGTSPKLSRAAAEKVASDRLEAVSRVEGSRLVVYALGTAPRLAWESTVAGVGGEGDSELTVDVDALTGAVLDSREGIARGAAWSPYNGSFTVATTKSTTQAGDVYALKDPAIARLECRDFSTGQVFTKPVDVWGGTLGKTDKETACADALFAAQTQTKMLSAWLGRNGLDGNGGAWPIRVGSPEIGASYSTGDPQVKIGHDYAGKLMSGIDLVGHEMGHGIDHHTPGGMSGNGTAEFVGDVFGAATEWFANAQEPYGPPDFMTASRAEIGQRYMWAPDWGTLWPCYTGSIPADSHDAAGVGDHWFYLLAEGSNPTDGQPVSPTCNGLAVPGGVGVQKATQILYNAMLMKTSSSSYPKYRTWTLTAAKNLTPGDCIAFRRTKAAWDAVKVPAQADEPGCTDLVVGGIGQTTSTVGKAQTFQLTASGGIPPYTWSVTGLPPGMTPTPSGAISGTPTVAGEYFVTYSASDGPGHAGQATIKWTVNATETGTFTGTASASKPTTAASLARGRANTKATAAGFALVNCADLDESIELNDFGTWNVSITIRCTK